MMITLADALANGAGVEREFCCPVHGDSNPSASVNTLKMVWVCYACGAKGRVGGEAMLGEIDHLAHRRQLRRQASRPEPLPEGWLNVFDEDHPYWKSRYAAATCARFRLGFDHESGCATIPLRSPTGDLLGVVRRDLGGSGRRYRYPAGVDVSKLLWNYHDSDADVVVLTEGATDSIAAWETGLPIAAMAMLGDQLRKPQATLLRQYNPTGIVVATDMDEAGKRAYVSVLKALPEFRIARALWRGGKDLSALSVSQRTEILSSALERFTKAA